MFHGLQNQVPFIDRWHVSTLFWGEGGGGGRGKRREKGSERRTHVAHITMEACTVNSLFFAQDLTSVPKCFDPDCRLEKAWILAEGTKKLYGLYVRPC